MAEIVVPLVVGLAGVITGIIFNSARVLFERNRRRRTLAAALSAEAHNVSVSLQAILTQHPKSEGLAPLTDQFYSSVGDFHDAGDVFFANLSNADVLKPEIVRRLAEVYTDLRVTARDSQRSAQIGSFNIPQGNTWACKDQLTETARRLKELGSYLGHV